MSKYADEGSAAHALAAMCLTGGTDANAYLGRLIELEDYEHAKLSPSGAKKWMACAGSHALERVAEGEFVDRFYQIEVTEEMAEYTQVYVDAVRQRVKEYELEGAVEVILLVEQSLPIGHITGEEGATGTGDAVIVAVWANGSATVDVGDLKTGMGVLVDATENEQLQLYALGAIEQLGLLYEFVNVRLTIYQPRISRTPSEWTISVPGLMAFGEKAKKGAERCHTAVSFFDTHGELHDKYLAPGDHCRTSFCKARATCPKLAAFVQEGVGADFEALDEVKHIVERAVPNADDDILATKMQAVDLIEDWCKAVRAEVERRLLAGTPVPGYKLVQGKRGARAWVNAEEAETTFKSMRLKQDEMYDFKLISPTTAEKLLKDTPKRWNRVLPLITQSEGKPSVAPESDKRPALTITPVENDFEVVGDDLAG